MTVSVTVTGWLELIVTGTIVTIDSSLEDVVEVLIFVLGTLEALVGWAGFAEVLLEMMGEVAASVVDGLVYEIVRIEFKVSVDADAIDIAVEDVT